MTMSYSKTVVDLCYYIRSHKKLGWQRIYWAALQVSVCTLLSSKDGHHMLVVGDKKVKR